jgi:AraC-like DNA-binding protein
VKVLPFQIPKPKYDALIFQEDEGQVFYDKFHQHNEIQVSLIEEGEGTLIVGDTINHYKKNDILVIGSNLPHVFKSEMKEHSNSKMISLFFTKDAFGSNFFMLEEMRELNKFFKKVDNGFKVSPSSEPLRIRFMSLKNDTKFERFISLLSILKSLSKMRSNPLSSFIYEKKLNDVEGKRMRDVMEYSMANYSKTITLDDISHVAAMTKNAFCKYFKKRTNKTYFKFLNEIRVEYACKLLVSNEDFSIAEIADKSGFNNISNFNRQFKSVKEVIPSEYKRLN